VRYSFLSGLMFLVIVILASFFIGDLSLILKICGGAGLLGILLSGIFLGAFVSGDQVRANYYTETKEDRSNRFKNVNMLLLFALPNLIASIITYLLTY
jgi:hypothetical protein